MVTLMVVDIVSNLCKVSNEELVLSFVHILLNKISTAESIYGLFVIV